jgi:DNA-binding response OmpR family regulator
MKLCPTCFQDIPERQATWGRLSVCRDKRECIIDGIAHHLKPTEANILHRLVHAKGNLVPYDAFSEVFSDKCDRWMVSLYVSIFSLRKIIYPLVIVRAYGEGYYLVDPEAAVHRAFDRRWKDVHD